MTEEQNATKVDTESTAVVFLAEETTPAPVEGVHNPFPVESKSSVVVVETIQEKKKKIPKLPHFIPPYWTNDQMHRWFKVDSTGIKDAGLNHYQIMEYAQVSCLDMLIFDRNRTFPCTILRRERVILLDLEVIKMIIMPEEVLVLEIREPECDLFDKLVRIFDGKSWEDIWDAYRDNVTPLELRALEVALGAICSYFNGKAHKLDNDIQLALREVTSKFTQVNFERVQLLSRDISKLKTSVEKVRDELARLMENYDDMASLYLSRTVDTSSSSNVNKILLMLQSYFTQTRMVGKKLSELLEGVDDKLELLEYQLIHDGTQLMKLTNIVNSASIGLLVCPVLYWLWVWYQSLAG